MLFAYKYVPHAMERMQEFIDFIFYEVWCKAPGNGDFRFELFDAHAELRELMEAFYYGDTQGGDLFYGHVEGIYGLFSQLTSAQIDEFRQWYIANNDIEKVCANEPGVQAVRYKDLIAMHPSLGKQLATFFRGLYHKSFLGLADVKARIGDIADHNKEFFTKNNTGKCPFCGISDMKGIHHTRREAYDHYLPKYRYPFNSINFRNLAPACHECNSTYKLSKDPVLNTAGPRKAFYPFATGAHGIEVRIDLNTPDIDRLTPADIQLAFGPAAVNEEIETWKEVYGIDERYKAKCCGSDAKDWLEQVRIFRDQGVAPVNSLSAIQQQTAKSPVANSNFLKLAFLEGCQRAGLFEAIEEEGATR